MRPFQHFNARNLDDAVLAADEKSMIIAGGTDCLSILKTRMLPTYPEVLVNIKTIPGLEYIEVDAEGLKVGTLTRLCDIEDSPIIKEKYGMLADAAKSIASPQIRNMGTIGGNLCQDVRCWYYRCSPLTGRDYFCYRKGGKICNASTGENRYHSIFGAMSGCVAVNPSDIAVVLIALNARIRTTKRTVEAEKFFTAGLMKSTILDPGEIVTEIQIPTPKPGSKQTFTKFRLRKSIDFAIVAVASVISTEAKKIKDASIVLGAVAPIPLRIRETEDFLREKEISEEVAEDAASLVVKGAKPLAENKYKIQITKTLVKRAILAGR